MHGDGHAVDHGRHSVDCFVPAVIAKNDSKHGNQIVEGGIGQRDLSFVRR